MSFPESDLNGFAGMDFDDDDDEGYVIKLDEHGPSLLEGRRFRRISQREAELVTNRKRFPKPNALGLTTLTVKEHEMVMKNRNVRRPFLQKFYIGSQEMARAFARGNNPTNTFGTIEEAVDAAKVRIESGASEAEIIVQIIRVVKRAPRPVRVEKV